MITADLTDKEKQKIEEAINSVSNSVRGGNPKIIRNLQHDNLIENLLNDIRDAKRFCNSFKIAFNILKKETNIHDLMVLELIRNRDIDVYNRIRKQEFLLLGEYKTKFEFNDNEWNDYSKKNEKKVYLDELREAVLSLLTFQNATDSDNLKRMFVDPHNFYLYFSYQLFNLISLEEFNTAFEKEEEGLLNQFKIWIHEGKERELLKIISYIETFANIVFFNKILIVYLKTSTSANDVWFGMVKTLLFSKRKENLSMYFNKDTQLHEAFIKAIITNSGVPLFIRAKLAFDFLYEHIGRNVETNDLVFTKKECQNCIYQLFDEYFNTSPVELKKIIEFYRLNYEEVKEEGGRIILTSLASIRLNKYLLSNKHLFEEYTRNILTHDASSSSSYLRFDGWLEQIFSSWEVYKKILEETKFINADMQQIKAITLQYIVPFFSNNKNPFIISNNDDKLFIEKIIKENSLSSSTSFN